MNGCFGNFEGSFPKQREKFVIVTGEKDLWRSKII